MSVFISYAHADRRALDRLLVHLRPLVKSNDLSVFSDLDIKTDQAWREEIRVAIDQASVAILLVSADFLASDFIQEQELPSLFEGRRRKEKKIISIFLSHCYIENSPEIANFQAFNDPKAPLSSLGDTEKEEFWSRVVGEVAQVSKDFSGSLDSEIKDWDNLPELDYKNVLGQRLFSGVRVSIPSLLAISNLSSLDGCSFENCWIEGPAILWAPIISATKNQFDVPGGNVQAMFLAPRNDFIVGVVGASHLSLIGCRVSNVGFVEKEPKIEKALNEADK
ncbi:toll/interleukin-1 receptor domain-containing protein [Limimaricola cinnabarinus]|uniref:TIR domain-containing protein n=1 Tax=Limimaricola cinnabarinus TaxID=1125964 RepID=A0A2G1MGG6_9RHOB|nr:toll/interleukin-1 receptor domain-containing protein [Limimaricola cinnabarinus]PHP27841.1 hypothetical protein CJ301_09230 [Limimaricola cinnabarinus]